MSRKPTTPPNKRSAGKSAKRDAAISFPSPYQIR
jgi:hypothetical protein